MVTNYDLHIGAHVKSKDGKKLGSIQKLIVHPDTSRVDGFLLGKGHFSTNRIVAMEQVETTDAEDNAILQEYQRGYNFKGKLLRPSMVKVAVRP